MQAIPSSLNQEDKWNEKEYRKGIEKLPMMAATPLSGRAPLISASDRMIKVRPYARKKAWSPHSVILILVSEFM